LAGKQNDPVPQPDVELILGRQLADGLAVPVMLVDARADTLFAAVSRIMADSGILLTGSNWRWAHRSKGWRNLQRAYSGC